MKELYKLKHSLYIDEDGLCALPFKWDYTYKLLARKGQLAERFELTDELRDKYSAYRSMWKYIWVFTTGHSWLLTQDKECDDFEKVVKQQAMSLDTEMAEQLVKLNEELKALQKEKELDNIFWKQECDSLQKTLKEKDKEIEKLKNFMSKQRRV